MSPAAEYEPLQADGLEQTGDPSERAFGPYVQAVRRHWVVVVSVAVLALIVAGITVARTSGSYDATASILVTPLPEGDASFVGIGTVVDTGDPARTMQTAAALVDTPNAAAAAAHALGAPWTQDSVRNAVSVSPLGASNVLNVSASASSPAGAQRLANAFAEKAIA